MALQVIGAGFGRTGTLSLKQALEKLGFGRCYHMMEVLQKSEHPELWQRAHAGEAVDWDALFQGYRASVDWPACNLWREQLAHFPEARVLLSLRDAEGWYRSVKDTIYRVTVDNCEAEDPNRRRFGEWAMEIIWRHVFDGRMEDREHVIGVFHAHNEAVIREVPEEKLLVYRPGDGWEPLCSFLEVPVPEEPYPHLNSSDEFRARLGAQA